MEEKSVPIASLISRFDAQGLWFLLLCCQVMFALVHGVKALLSIDASVTFHLLSLCCAVVAYSIVLWKSFGPVRLSAGYWSLMIVNESFAYMLLSLVFIVFVRPVMILILVPFSVYSCYHMAHYTRTMLLKHPYIKFKLSSVELVNKCSDWLVSFENVIQTEMLRNVAILEIMILPSMLLNAIILGQVNVVGMLALFQFIRFRFAVSPHMQWAFTHIRTVGDSLSASNRCPVSVANAWHKAKNWLTDWSASDRFILALKTQVKHQRLKETSKKK